jgi:hypothetical protein
MEAAKSRLGDYGKRQDAASTFRRLSGFVEATSSGSAWRQVTDYWPLITDYFPCSFTHVSFNVMMRLNTGFPGMLSLQSAQK